MFVLSRIPEVATRNVSPGCSVALRQWFPLCGGGHENMVDPQIPQALATLIGILMIHLAPDGGSSGRAQKTGGSNKSETKSH